MNKIVELNVQEISVVSGGLIGTLAFASAAFVVGIAIGGEFPGEVKDLETKAKNGVVAGYGYVVATAADLYSKASPYVVKGYNIASAYLSCVKTEGNWDGFKKCWK